MIKSEKDYQREMRKMIRRIQSGSEINDRDASIEEMEILSDCIRAGYLIGKTTYTDSKTGKECELRTINGKMHPTLLNNTVSPKGLAFLKPNRTNRKSNIALIVSISASVISLLANLDRIIENWELFTSWLTR